MAALRLPLGSKVRYIKQNVRTKLLLLTGALVLASTGCEREPLDWICPPSLDPGDLVVTELRGKKGDSWIEIYNATGDSVDLEGLELGLTRLDGKEGRIVIRASVPVAAGDYAVIGSYAAGLEPDYVDYGYLPDFSNELYDSGVVDLNACGERIDRAIYHNLPSSGTLALDGAIDPPTAAANDDEMSWCVDDSGTPGEGNSICP